MTSELKEIVEEAMELTGAPAPALLGVDAPVLDVDAARDEPLYLIGLIGGKEVGKSSLVNALAGSAISQQSSHGPGTEEVIAYAHRSAIDVLRAMLERIAPGKFRIVSHDVAELSRQVLVDLPDIDSHWTDHVALTRKMLRHLLYPVWIQSVEKYADVQPQRLLAQVAAGNDPSNFVFCLNKADQLRGEKSAAEELRTDCAGRLAKTLALSSSPQVFLISALSPQSLDLPSLRAMLSQQKSTSNVDSARRLAASRQDRTLLSWLDACQLPSRADAARRLLQQAQESLAERVGTPLLETELPQIQNDSGYQFSIVEPVIQRRLSRWPLVNVLQNALAPVMSIVQKNLGDGAVVQKMRAPAVQPTFAMLNQSHQLIGPLYRQHRLWEDLPAEQAVSDLRNRLERTIERQRLAAMNRIARPRILFLPLRWLLTIGAVVWFPIAQPILQSILSRTWGGFTRETLLLAVEVLSVAYLFKSLIFLLIYVAVLWAILRWSTRRRVNALLRQWLQPDAQVAVSLSETVMEWQNELLKPIQDLLERSDELANRLERTRQKVLT